MNIEKATTPQPSLSETSHKSQDSGFSDSEGHVPNYCGTKPCDDSDTRSSSEDLSTLPPPPHSSTPKTKEHISKCCQMEERIYCSREWYVYIYLFYFFNNLQIYKGCKYISIDQVKNSKNGRQSSFNINSLKKRRIVC